MHKENVRGRGAYKYLQGTNVVLVGKKSSYALARAILLFKKTAGLFPN